MDRSMSQGMSRRAFLRASGLLAGGAGVMVALGGCTAPQEMSDDVANQVVQRVTTELPIPEAVAPQVTSYDCDVLVIGGGFAGLNAAMAAKAAGSTVVLVDKGRPGHSGLSPWPSSHRWFDADMGDVEEAFKDAVTIGSEYLANMSWYQQWIDHSKETYERLAGWGIMDRYDRAADTAYFETLDYQGYYEANISSDRHGRFSSLLEENDVSIVDYTMITDVVCDVDRVVGAVGLHVPSGTIVSFGAKAVVMAMGGGCFKPTGYPVGGNTFDGEYIAYNLGLPIAGKEYDDFHTTVSFAPGNAFVTCSWDYLENIWLCGGDVTPDNAAKYAASKEKVMVMSRVTGTVNGIAANDGTRIEDQANADITRRGGTSSDSPDDIRIGKMVSPKPKGDIYGAAVGMCAHLSSGVFCGIDEVEGATGIPGLWVAGDGMNASCVTGAAYPVGVGFTSNFCSIQGDIAGKAAAAYAAGVEAGVVREDELSRISEEVLAPLSLEKGFSPDWARDALQAIMSPYWIMIEKSEESLSGALAQVEFMRDNVVPKLMASNPHQLRLAIEMKHKILSAEMKLRASLARTESRGLHYRSDYPFRDDENFLTYSLITKGEDGSMEVGGVDVPEEWTGDTSEAYATRYVNRFPSEVEALGLPAEEEAYGGWGK